MRILSFLVFNLFLLQCSTLQRKVPKFLSDDKVKFSIVGDIMSHQTQINSAFKKDCNCYNYLPVFAHVKPILQRADFVIGNLETPLPGNPKDFSGYPTFGAPDELAFALKDAGFDLLTTSNNHSVDKGSKGIDHTLDVLDELKILHVGTYRSKEEFEKNRIVYFTKNNIRFALLAYTYSTNGILIPKNKVVNLIDKKKIKEDMNLINRDMADFIIVYFHFGTEYSRLPDSSQKELVDLVFDEGADIILGGHPHVLQPFELKRVRDKYGIEKKRLVIYSLGNFVSAQIKKFTTGGMIFNFSVSKLKNIFGKDEMEIGEVDYVPVYVYVYNQLGTYDYLVLPISQFLKNPTDIKITDNGKKLMQEFLDETVSHLESNSIR